MTTGNAQAKIFQWLCSHYHDKGKTNNYIDAEVVKKATNIPDDVFVKALNEFVDPAGDIYVQVETSRRCPRLGTGGEQLCQEGRNPFT
jgi:hypothetical protein